MEEEKKETTNNNETKKDDGSLKLVLLGDSVCGKTTLIHTFIKKEYPETYEPTVSEQESGNITIQKKKFKLSIWDTAGNSDYARLRPLAYPKTHSCILFYAIDNRESFDHVNDFYEEYRESEPETEVILVGTHVERRGKEEEGEYITKEEGEEKQEEIGASYFMEISTKSEKDARLVIENAVRAGLPEDYFSTGCCCTIM
mmetsp:Transcript_11636/g.17228  ORF Transcript_11636/g.17228 Transcript_11636/m.17228 type:complete len:200 (+) Transcript_11636:50-649(+)